MKCLRYDITLEESSVVANEVGLVTAELWNLNVAEPNVLMEGLEDRGVAEELGYALVRRPLIQTSKRIRVVLGYELTPYYGPQSSHRRATREVHVVGYI
jgi:hypothetical protein